MKLRQRRFLDFQKFDFLRKLWYNIYRKDEREEKNSPSLIKNKEVFKMTVKQLYTQLSEAHKALASELTWLEANRGVAVDKQDFIKQKLNDVEPWDVDDLWNRLDALESEIECYDYQIDKVKSIIADLEKSLTTFKDNLMILSVAVRRTYVGGYDKYGE